MKKRFVLALALALCLLAPSAMAAEEGALYVGGVALESGQYLGNDGTVSETEPEDGYAWYEDGVLTLKNYEYAGSGYCWTEEAGEESGSFSVCVYADGPLHIQVEGGARLTNTSDARWSDGIAVREDLTLSGGLLELNVPGDGLFTLEGGVTVEDGEVYILSDESGVNSTGDVRIAGSRFYVKTEGDGIYAYEGNVDIVDSEVTIEAGLSGIYAYDGEVDIDAAHITVDEATMALHGTTVSITAGEEAAVFAYEGLGLMGGLTVTLPEGGELGPVFVDDTEEPYVYHTVLDSRGLPAKEVFIQPLTYEVSFGDSFAFPVPVWMSFNEIYGDISGQFAPVEEGHVFGGWMTADGLYDFDAPVEEDVELRPMWLQPLYVGGTELPVGQYLDSDGNLGAEAPGGGYAYHGLDGVLTLCDYVYTGDGLLLGTEEYEDGEESYAALIYREGPLEIRLKGKNFLSSTFNDPEQEHYGDGIMVDGGGEGISFDLTISGDGYLEIADCSYCVNACGDVDAADVQMALSATESGIVSQEGGVVLENARMYINAKETGIFSVLDMTVTDTELDITVERDGIYVYDGSLYIDCIEVTPMPNSPGFDGTRVDITASGEKGRAFTVDMGALVISDRLTVSSPEGARVETFESVYDADGDGVKETPYTYDTIVDDGGEAAAAAVIEPLVYEVTPMGLDIGHSIVFPVPVGMSLEEIYGALYAELLTPEKEGFLFAGWFTGESCGGDDAYSIETPVEGDMTIYAKWVEEKAAGGASKPAIRPAEKTEEAAISLVDVPADAWYAEAAAYVCEKGIMKATSEGLFSPEGGVNRAQMAQMLWNLEGCPVVNYAMSFTDVGEGWESVRWAVSEGYMQGYGDGSFGLGDELTREQLAAILYRYAQKQGGGFTGSWMFLLDCADRAEVSPWAYEAVCWMNMHGIINGKGGYIAPKDMVTNAEAAAIWMRYLEQ